jgi:hypothetical protein
VNRGAAREAEHHEQLLLRPDAQLARRLADIAGVGRPDLADDAWRRRVRGVDHEHAGVRVRVGGVGAVADVDVVTVDRERGVHASRVEGVVPDELEVAARSGPDGRGDVVERCRGRRAAGARVRACGCRRRECRRGQRRDEEGGDRDAPEDLGPHGTSLLLCLTGVRRAVGCPARAVPVLGPTTQLRTFGAVNPVFSRRPLRQRGRVRTDGAPLRRCRPVSLEPSGARRTPAGTSGGVGARRCRRPMAAEAQCG